MNELMVVVRVEFDCLQTPVIAVSVLAAYLLYVGRKKFCGLLN
mgnify:CR=1 FL=1